MTPPEATPAAVRTPGNAPNVLALPIAGAYILEPEPFTDERGTFARMYDRDRFPEWGLDPEIAQMSTSFNVRAGTIRGMHFQTGPYAETKLVRCTQGSLFDVVLDLRRDSPTFCRWTSVELSAENRRTVYLSKGLAHGFYTRVDGTELLYCMSSPFHPDHSTGVRYDDPAFGIAWPGEPTVVSAKDAGYPDFAP